MQALWDKATSPSHTYLRAFVDDIRQSELSYLGSKKILSMHQVEVADKYLKLFEQSTLSASGDNLAMIKYGVRIDGSTIPKGDPRLDANTNP